MSKQKKGNILVNVIADLPLKKNKVTVCGWTGKSREGIKLTERKGVQEKVETSVKSITAAPLLQHFSIYSETDTFDISKSFILHGIMDHSLFLQCT